MPKPNSASADSKRSAISRQQSATQMFCWLLVTGYWLRAAGCATPQYAIRPTPVPEESASALEIERTISAYQAKEFEQQGARRIGAHEVLRGFEVQSLVDRLSRVTERPGLMYQAYLYPDKDPNAAALADGRIYISTGMINYLAERGGREDEPAFVLGHEIAHTVAQHLVKRYRALQQQQLLMALVAAGVGVATRGRSASAQQAGNVALDVASTLQDVHNSGFSQEQELEADQLGITYVIKTGFNPKAALDLMEDFSKFENPWPFLRTHPYSALRRQYLERYLQERGYLQPQAAAREDRVGRFSATSPPPLGQTQGRIQQLRDTQKLYPEGSVSWKNLQNQIDRLDRRK